MQPIKTANAMNPAPAKGIESFPTPVIDDIVITEIVNAWKGDYQKLEYGTLWNDISHAPNQGSFPEHKLVYQEPATRDGEWVKRIWVNDRVNQESYNYAIKYMDGSKDHPIYSRTFIVPRDQYAPLDDGTPDPLFPGAVLTEQEVTRNEDELDSKYVTVTRIYETLNGPVVSSQSLVDTPVGLAVGTLSKQTIIGAGATPSGSFNTIQDQIAAIDTYKAQRETITVPTYPELTTYDLDESLGVSIITEREVVSHNTPYSAPPLVLSLTDRPLDQWKTLRITSRLSNLPAPRIEYETKQFAFPAILLNTSNPSGIPVNVTQQNVGFGRVATSVEGVTDWVASGANKFISITPNQLRPSVSVPTRFKTITTFIDVATNPGGIIPVSPSDDVYKISPQSVSYSGSLFSFSFGEVLTNGFTISVQADDNDQRYAGLNETITIAPSSPTASQYWLTDRFTEKLISWDVEYYRSNIWILRETYINLI